MTSFADDNRNILRSGKTKYNRTVSAVQEPVMTAPQPEYAGKSIMSQGETSSSELSEIKDFIKRYKAVRKKKNDKFRNENEKVIRNSFLAGTKKVDYNYRDYRVKDNSFPIAILGIAAAITLVVMLLIRIYTFMAMYTSSINDLKKEITDYKVQKNELMITLGKREDKEAIDEYAEIHGMVKAEQLETSYIRLSDAYVIEKNEEKEDEYAINTVMSGVSRLLNGALGN